MSIVDTEHGEGLGREIGVTYAPSLDYCADVVALKYGKNFITCETSFVRVVFVLRHLIYLFYILPKEENYKTWYRINHHQILMAYSIFDTAKVNDPEVCNRIQIL